MAQITLSEGWFEWHGHLVIDGGHSVFTRAQNQAKSCLLLNGKILLAEGSMALLLKPKCVCCDSLVGNFRSTCTSLFDTIPTLRSPSSKNLTATSPTADVGLGTGQEPVNPHKGNLS